MASETDVTTPPWIQKIEYLTDEHRSIADASDDVRGTASREALELLFQVAWHRPESMLHLGAGNGLVARALATGAAASTADGVYVGLDHDPDAVRATRGMLSDVLVSSLVHCCDLGWFTRFVPLVPSMVCMQPMGTPVSFERDLRHVSRLVANDTPVVCVADRPFLDVARRLAPLFASLREIDGGVVLLGRDAEGLKRSTRLTPHVVRSVAHALEDRIDEATYPTPTEFRTLTAPLRDETWDRVDASLRSGRGVWPMANPEPDLPPTLPDGTPWPRISVITPTYNQGRYIEQTILSILNQGYPNVEHIIVDGESTDETPDVLDRYRDRVATVISEPDDGQSDAINKGMSKATGEILTWLNSDDMLAPGALASMALAFHTSGADMVAGICRTYRDGVLTSQHLTSCENGPLPLEDVLDLDNCWNRGQFFYQPEVMFTRDLWERAGGSVRVDAYYSMDYELWARFAAAQARLHVIGRPVCWFRVHDEQKTAIPEHFKSELPKVRDALVEELGLTIEPREPEDVRTKLSVVFFNDHGYHFGAGIAHRRLAQCFADAGHDVHALCARDLLPGEDAPRIEAEAVEAEIAKREPHLVVIGNIHAADLDPALVGRLSRRFPTAFVLHDAWMLTGRCAYPGACTSFRTGCGEDCTCPAGYPELDRAKVGEAWAMKRRVLTAEAAPLLLGNSEWMATLAREAMEADPTVQLTGVAPDIDCIRFGYELDVFTPRDRRACQEALGLPHDRFIIATSASSLEDERKGLAYLRDALEILDLPDVEVISPGWFRDGQDLPIRGMRAMGYTKEPIQLARIFGAADLFVGPSLEEAFGQVFVEAAACGTPSVGFPVGGVPEAIADGVSGLLAHDVTPDALAHAILTLYLDADRRRWMSRWGRLWVENEWSMASAYHRTACVRRRHRLASQVGLGRKISIGTKPLKPVEIVTPTLPEWVATGGMGGWAPPNGTMPRHRAVFGPVSLLRIHGERAGPARLVFTVRNRQPGQRIRLFLNGKGVGERILPVTPESDHIVTFDTILTQGVNEAELHSWRWNVKQKPHAFSLMDLHIVPAS
ncbi:MAG: glycosyltransferase [Phycisphaerales bacterium]|nr:glycosyltransferase [Phycisphaerales bacterium]